MEVLKVNPIKKEGNTWYIPSEGVPQDMKNKYLNKSV